MGGETGTDVRLSSRSYETTVTELDGSSSLRDLDHLSGALSRLINMTASFGARKATLSILDSAAGARTSSR